MDFGRLGRWRLIRGRVLTAPLALSFFAGSQRMTDQTVVAAAAVLVALPVIAFYVVLQRPFIRGFLTGAVREEEGVTSPMASIRLAYLGGGSTGAAGTMAGFIHNHGASFAGSEIVLIDLASDRLAIVQRLAERMTAARGLDLHCNSDLPRRPPRMTQ